MSVPARRARPARRLLADDGGAASIEFVVLFPALMYCLFGMAEIGTLMVRQVMLERGVDIAVRDIRLGLPGLGYDSVKAKICDAAFLLGSCEEVLRLEFTPLSAGGGLPAGPVRCVDRAEEIQPMVDFDPGAREEIVLVRACLVADPVFPGTGLGAMLPRDASGGYAIVVTSAFMNEPG